MNPDIWSADQKYGQWLRKNDRQLYRGYVRWARIVTAWMEGKGPTYMPWIKDTEERAVRQKEYATKWAYKLGGPWSEHMAYLMGALPKDNIQGRILMAIGRPICRIADLMPRRRKGHKHGLGIMCVMWSLFYFSYYTSFVGNKLHSFLSSKK